MLHGPPHPQPWNRAALVALESMVAATVVGVESLGVASVSSPRGYSGGDDGGCFDNRPDPAEATTAAASITGVETTAAWTMMSSGVSKAAMELSSSPVQWDPYQACRTPSVAFFVFN